MAGDVVTSHSNDEGTSSRLQELQDLADEDLITPEEHEQHRRYIREEAIRRTSPGSDAEADGRSGPAIDARGVKLLDELIGRWLKWEVNERYYLEELAPAIVLSDPAFRWISSQAERRTVIQLRSLMSPGDWRVLPELIRERRHLGFHELGAGEAAERARREREAWPEARARARRDGEERIRRERDGQPVPPAADVLSGAQGGGSAEGGGASRVRGDASPRRAMRPAPRRRGRSTEDPPAPKAMRDRLGVSAISKPPPARAGDAAPAATDRQPTPLVAGIEDYARRLRRSGEDSLARALSQHAERAAAVERGELAPALGLAVTPDMVGAALTHSRTEPWIEGFRNLLIFAPVLWTWLKLQAAIAAYPSDYPDTFFEFWVRQGGTGLLGGTLESAALQVAAALVLLIAANVSLEVLRSRAARQRGRIGRDFAALLARAETAGAVERVRDPQAVLERQLATVIERLGRVAEISDHLGGLQGDFARAESAATRSAEELAGIREALEPSASDFAAAAKRLERLAEQLERMTENMSEVITGLESGLDASSQNLRDAASSMNTVAVRVLDELGDGRDERR